MSVEAENKRALSSESEDSTDSWDGPKLSEINKNPNSENSSSEQPITKKRKSSK
jgi:hypothetical protein